VALWFLFLYPCAIPAAVGFFAASINYFQRFREGVVTSSQRSLSTMSCSFPPTVSCPNGCSGHGTCLSMGELSRARANVNSRRINFEYGSSQVSKHRLCRRRFPCGCGDFLLHCLRNAQCIALVVGADGK
jgi:hypothetical protein